MKRLLLIALVAGAASLNVAPATAVCQQFGPICLPRCPLPDPSDPLHYACPL